LGHLKPAKIPLVGLGTWKSKPGEVKAAVEHAIDAGYRHIDCAAVYGNEKEIGEALKNKFASGTKREDLYIVSKLWNSAHDPQDVLPNCRQTLEDLGLKYLDLYLIHWPYAFQRGGDKFPRNKDGSLIYSDVDYVDTWKAMEELVNKGLVRAIGLSNFNSKQIERILKVAKVPIASLQVECHPYLTQDKLIAFAQKNGIQVVAYSPLGSPDRPWAKKGEPQLMDDPKIKAVADKYKKSPAQILLRFQTQRGVAVIPKSVTPSRIKQNRDLDFTLSDADMATIRSFDRGHRFCIPMIPDDKGQPVPRDGKHKYYPFNEEY